MTNALASFDPSTALARGESKRVPITSIVPDATGLRKNVNKKDKKWAGLVGSIKRDGIQHAVTVRENPLPDAEHPYILIDGLHRWTAAMEIWEEMVAAAEAEGQTLNADDYLVPVSIVPVQSAMDVYRLQLAGNLQSIDTRPVQVRDHLLAMIAEAKENGMELTQADLAAEIDKSQTYVSNILKISNLTEEAAKVVDETGVTVANAYNLARLPKEEQEHWIERAQTLDSNEFALQVGQELKKIRDAQLADKKARGDEFQGPVPKLLSKTDALKLMDNWFGEHFEPAGGEEFVNNVFAQVNAKDESDQPINADVFNAFLVGTYYGFQLMLQVDAGTAARKKAEHDARVAEQNRKKAQADAEKEAKKAAERGVGILMPEGKASPTGFGSAEVSLTPDAEPAEATA